MTNPAILLGKIFQVSEFESERNREGDLVGLLDETTLVNIHRYEVQYSNQFSKVLDKLQQFQSSRVGLRPRAPAPVELEIIEYPIDS